MKVMYCFAVRSLDAFDNTKSLEHRQYPSVYFPLILPSDQQAYRLNLIRSYEIEGGAQSYKAAL